MWVRMGPVGVSRVTCSSLMMIISSSGCCDPILSVLCGEFLCAPLPPKIVQSIPNRYFRFGLHVLGFGLVCLRRCFLEAVMSSAPVLLCGWQTSSGIA
jgi:hypothetical protein